MWCASRHVTRVFAIVRSGGAALSAVRTAPQPHARRAIHSHTACRGAGKPTAAKPRAAKSARQTSLARNTKQQVIFGMIGGSALYFGYHLYTTKQTPWEWATKLYGDALDAYQDAADPTEDFIRNSIQPVSMMQRQGFVGTVIVDLEDTILCRKWDRKHGYRFSKRPYADEFLMQVSQAGFEVIFYSDLPQAMGMETLNKLINGYPPGTVTCSGLLGREHMFFRNGKFVKRLNFLPRDMNKVVMVDADAETYTWNPRNTLLVKPYKEHDPKDTTLRSAAKMILAMKNSGLPYQKFMGDFAQPSKDADGNLVPSEDAVAKFAAQERERMVKAAEKKRTGVSGLLRNLKGSSNNLRRSKVISPHAMSVEDIMRAKRTDGSQAVPTGLVGQPAPSKPKSLFERKMAKMHARQREWEEKMKLMQASAQDEAGQQGGAPPTK